MAEFPEGVGQASHPLEIKCGALVVPRALLQIIMKSLPKDTLRDSRACTCYNDDKLHPHGASPAMAALHLSHEALVALEAGCSPTAVLGSVVADYLRNRENSWAIGLRALAKSCRSFDESRVFDAWHRVTHGTLEHSDHHQFLFVELFAGIGGFRLGLEPLGGVCAFAVELDDGARAIYNANFQHECVSDVVALDVEDIPSHDILTAGFPCQPFAFCNTGNAMISGRLDAGPGLREAKQGALGLEVVRVLRAKRPRAFILENVPNLQSFNGGADLAALEDALKQVGYVVHINILDARHFGLPQQRRRLYIVGLRSDLSAGALAAFQWPVSQDSIQISLRDILEPPSTVPQDCLLSDRSWELMRCKNPKAVFPSGRGGRIARLDGYARTLMSSYRRNGATYSELVPTEDSTVDVEENPQEPNEHMEEVGHQRCDCDFMDGWCEGETAYVETRDGKHLSQSEPHAQPLPAWLPGQSPPRFFTKRECCRLQGFPDDFITEAPLRKCKDSGRFYHFIGNAVAPPVIRALGEVVVNVLEVAVEEPHISSLRSQEL